MKKLDCCVQGQGQSNISKCQWMFVHMISSEPLNFLLPNVVWWCIIMSQIIFPKNWFAVFKIKVTMKNHLIKIWLSDISPELLLLFQLKLIWWHTDFFVKRLDCSVVATVKVGTVQNSSQCSSWRCHLNCWTFCNQTWYCDASSWARLSRKKIGLQVTHNQMWPFLPYLVNCWSFCSQI